MYHITKNTDPEKQEKDSLKPVLFLHGSVSNASNFADFGAGLPFQLFDEGFDVWLGNMRGSNESECATAVDADGFVYTVDCGYDALFSIQDMAEKDTPAFVQDVLDRTGADFVSLVGFSRGTTQILVGLTSLGDELQSKVDQAVLLAPCLINDTPITVDQHTAWTAWRSGLMGINNTRPDQYAEHVDLFCNPPTEMTIGDEIFDVEITDELQGALDYVCGWMSDYPITEIVDHGSQDYLFQLGATQTFQKVIPREDFEDGVRIAEALRLADITGTRVDMYVGIADEFCNVGQAREIYDGVGTDQKSFAIIEYIDSEADELAEMGHFEWGLPLSDEILKRVSNTLRDGASYLTAVGALTISAIAFY